MKKTYLLILTLALTVTVGYAQDKLFKEALSQQRPTGCWYRWENTKDKQIKMEKVQAYAQKNNLLLGKTTTKEVGRFGDIAVSAHTVEFIPPEEIPAYIIENILDKKTSVAYMTSKGAALVVDNPSKQQYFKWVNDIIWSGKVVDGRIDGNGKGGKQIDATNYIAFEGTFKRGIPQGTVKFYTYQASTKYEYYSSKRRSDRSEDFGTMNDGMTWFKGAERENSIYYSYGFIDENGRVVAKPVYESVTDYNNGKAIVTINNVRFDIDKQGNVTGLSEGQKNVTVQQLTNIKKRRPETLSATQTAAKQLITKSDVDNLIMIATEFTALRGDVETELKSDIPSYTLAELAKVDNAFGNLKDQTLKRRTAIYNADCAKLAAAYDNAVASSKQHQENTNDRDFVSQFVSNYESTYKFDPDHKVAVAKQMQDYYEICDAVSFKPNSSYTCLTCDPPVYYGDDGTFDWLIAVWRKTSNPPADFKEYADYARPLIEKNGNKLYYIINTEIDAYETAFRKAKSNAYLKLENIRTYSDLEPHIKEIDEWKTVYNKEVLGPETLSSRQTTFFRFTDGFDIHVVHECKYYLNECYYYYWFDDDSSTNKSQTRRECALKGYIEKKKKVLFKQYAIKNCHRPLLPWN